MPFCKVKIDNWTVSLSFVRGRIMVIFLFTRWSQRHLTEKNVIVCWKCKFRKSNSYTLFNLLFALCSIWKGTFMNVMMYVGNVIFKRKICRCYFSCCPSFSRRLFHCVLIFFNEILTPCQIDSYLLCALFYVFF